MNEAFKLCSCRDVAAVLSSKSFSYQIWYYQCAGMVSSILGCLEPLKTVGARGVVVGHHELVCYIKLRGLD